MLILSDIIDFAQPDRVEKLNQRLDADFTDATDF